MIKQGKGGRIVGELSAWVMDNSARVNFTQVHPLEWENEVLYFRHSISSWSTHPDRLPQGSPNVAPYSVTKFGIRGLTQSLGKVLPKSVISSLIPPDVSK